jgi:hypothetical protein
MRQPTILDNRPVGNPVGMTGRRLEVLFWRVTMDEPNLRLRVGMVNGMSMMLRDFILASHAAACAVATEAEKQGGVLLIDMGAGTTDWILYYKEHILCAGSTRRSGRTGTAGSATSSSTAGPSPRSARCATRRRWISSARTCCGSSTRSSPTTRRSWTSTCCPPA